jgi:hypothetical protein
MVLRDQVDVAHIRLATFDTEHLVTLQLYSEQAVSQFRSLLQRVCAAVDRDEWEVPPYVQAGIGAETLRSLELIRRALQRAQAGAGAVGA